ncbi:MAG TPA: hypothetical protein VEW06_01945 [Xanthobacteraceae bacterium]|jgi:hypothetical protein|nr:hypothetical protein [Xanthobacteraceae bacterium]
MTKVAVTLAAAVLAFATSPAFAQQAQTQRVMGTISGIDGSAIVVKTKDAELKVNLTDTVAVFGVEKAALADLKAGAFVGVGAMPQPDGSQKAIRVMIFAETQRGTGEGHRPWVQPGSTMTNATIDTTVGSVDGQVLMVKYKDGEKKIVVPPNLELQRYVVGDKAELKPGAAILIVSAVKKPDGTLEASRVNVGRGGVVPN